MPVETAASVTVANSQPIIIPAGIHKKARSLRSSSRDLPPLPVPGSCDIR
ncbi:MAG: hypothetical protein Q4B10_07150 [Actinomycetaceae bacterium]|nr:hypothetical protein [Actinomycetaceae bacterium]